VISEDGAASNEEGRFTPGGQLVSTRLQWKKRSGTARWRKRSRLLAPGVPRRKQCQRWNIAGEVDRWRTARSAVLFSPREDRTLSGQSLPASGNHRSTSILLGYLDLGYLDLGYLDLGYLDLGYLDLGYLDLGYLELGYFELGYLDRRVLPLSRLLGEGLTETLLQRRQDANSLAIVDILYIVS
jgi:hypothetical protein